MPQVISSQLGIRQVAQQLSLSICTVSKALNGRQGVGEKVRRQVLDAAEKLGYVPNQQARILSKGRAHRIELHLPTLTNPVYSETMGDIYKAAAEHGYEVLVSTWEGDIHQSRRLGLAAIGRRSEAVLLPGGWGRVPVEAMIKAGMAVILINPGRNKIAAGVAALDTDVEEGIRQLVLHVLRLGHRRPVLTGNWMEDGRYKDGLLRALREAGLPEDDFVTLPSTAGIDHMLENYELVMEAFKGGRRPGTVFLASNDQGAIGAIAALHELGLSVPQDVSVAGVDNIGVSRFSSPPLTTVSQTHLHLGRHAVEMAISILKEESPRELRRVLKPELVVRQSTGKVNPEGLAALSSTFSTGGLS